MDSQTKEAGKGEAGDMWLGGDFITVHSRASAFLPAVLKSKHGLPNDTYEEQLSYLAG